jgi:hypothetical protein
MAVKMSAFHAGRALSLQEDSWYTRAIVRLEGLYKLNVFERPS